jgi:hypothetical protein
MRKLISTSILIVMALISFVTPSKTFADDSIPTISPSLHAKVFMKGEFVDWGGWEGSKDIVFKSHKMRKQLRGSGLTEAQAKSAVETWTSFMNKHDWKIQKTELKSLNPSGNLYSLYVSYSGKDRLARYTVFLTKAEHLDPAKRAKKVMIVAKTMKKLGIKVLAHHKEFIYYRHPDLDRDTEILFKTHGPFKNMNDVKKSVRSTINRLKKQGFSFVQIATYKSNSSHSSGLSFNSPQITIPGGLKYYISFIKNR